MISKLLKTLVFSVLLCSVTYGQSAMQPPPPDNLTASQGNAMAASLAPPPPGIPLPEIGNLILLLTALSVGSIYTLNKKRR
ncbi:MAG: hypothetical protein KBS98_01315 [Flavobacterium sp.]|nr:hypothetical protein [Candidatus Neoflavobacterium equi]